MTAHYGPSPYLHIAAGAARFPVIRRASKNLEMIELTVYGTNPPFPSPEAMRENSPSRTCATSVFIPLLRPVSPNLPTLFQLS
ncbi:hypothetical protein PhaeoP72_04007 (plasmid) [Phaeobacter inhibens]|nr:hypothetical protein PhaeoP72_04007 [Phaeobacter inhibens]